MIVVDDLDLQHFETQGYAVLRSVLSEEICTLAEEYALMQQLTQPNFGAISRTNRFKVHSGYSDLLMESLLIKLQPRFEDFLQQTLVPTYSMYRIYRPGSELRQHIDRESCEISASLNLAVKAIDPWPIFMRSNPVELQTGDAVLYEGMKVPHSRERMTGDIDGYCIQVFLHYCRAEGEYADRYIYDTRPALGWSSDSRNPELFPEKK